MTVVAHIEGMARKWRVLMQTVPLSALSLEYVRWTVWADENGLIVDPTSGTVEAAFMLTNTEQPQTGDWKAASWTTTSIGGFVAQCLVGPGGAFAPTAQTIYAVWLRITFAGGEQVVRQTGSLRVE